MVKLKKDTMQLLGLGCGHNIRAFLSINAYPQSNLFIIEVNITEVLRSESFASHTRIQIWA